MSSPGGAYADDSLLLVLTQPGLHGFTEHLSAEIVDELADDDEHKGDGVEEVDAQAKHLDSDHDAPEVAGEQGDVEKGRAGEPEEQGRQTVEQEETQRIPDQVARHRAVPDRLHAHDDGSVHAQLAEHLVHRPLAHQVLLRDVREAVKSSSKQRKQVSLDQVAARLLRSAAVGARDVV